LPFPFVIAFIVVMAGQRARLLGSYLPARIAALPQGRAFIPGA